MARTGVSIVDIPIYVPLCRPNAKRWKSMKNQRYMFKMLVIPQGMICTMDIVPSITRMKYDDHYLLALIEINAFFGL